MKMGIFIRNQFVLCLCLLFSVFVFSQLKPQLIIPEGIKNNLSTNIVKDKDQTQLVFNENNKIVVWDLIENREKYNVKFQSEVNSLAFHPSGKYIYISTDNNTIYILNSENGTRISQRSGSNYVDKNFSPFIDNKYLYIKDNKAYIADIFLESDEKIEIPEDDFYLIHAQYDPKSQLLFLFSFSNQIQIYDKDFKFYGKLSLEDYNRETYTFNNNIITYNSTSSTFKVYDLKLVQLKNEIKVQNVENNGSIHTFYNKTKKYIGHYQNKLFLYENNSILIKDLISGKTINAIPLKFKTVEDIVLSKNGNSLMIYGNLPYINEYGYDTTIKDIHIYDLTDYSLKEFENRIESQSNWSANSVIFDDENFHIYRFAQNQILKNAILSGHLESSYQMDKEKEIDVYSSNKPAIINGNYILIKIKDKNYKESLAYIELKTNKILWTFEIENSSFQMKVNEKQQILTIINENYPNNTYTVLDMTNGKTLFQEKSEESLLICPLNKEKILKLSTSQGGDWKNPVKELHISEYSISENKNNLHKISIETGWIRDVLLTDKYLYINYLDKILTFELHDLSKPINAVTIDMQNHKVIDIYNNEFLFVYSLFDDKTFSGYNLTNNETIFEQKNLTFIDYVKPLNQILVKDSKSDLYLFNVTTQDLYPTEINLSEVNLHRDFKIFHDKWLVYKTDKNQIIYDLVNNSVKHYLDESDIESVSKDGNLYYTFGKIKYAKDGSNFSTLANEVAIPTSASEFSLGINSDEIIYFDDNGLLNILNFTKNQIKSFQFLSTSSSYDRKYEQLSANLFLLSSEDELSILNSNTNKVVSLSDNAFEMNNFEIDNELLIVTEFDRLKLFNLNDAEQILDVESYQHRKLNKNLIIFKDLEKISLYNIQRNSILWETELANYIGSGLFSPISGHTIFTTLNENEIGALDLRTGKIKSRHTLSLEMLKSVGKLSIHPETNHLYVHSGSMIETKYQVFDYQNGEFKEVNIEPENPIAIEKLKQEFQIDDDKDNFSLSNTILAIHKRPTNIFWVYDTQTQSVLLEQKIELNDPYSFTWDVLEADKTIFMYNNSGDVVLIDYGTNKVYKHKINGNKFRIDNNLLFVSDYGKKIDIYNLKNVEKLSKMYSLIPLPNGDYMFYTEEGYYLSTKEAAKKIQFKLNESLFSFEQFDLIYNRPDLVLKAMQSTNTDLIDMYENAYQKRLKRQEYTVTTSLELAPYIEIINKELTQANETIFELKIKANGKTEGLSKIVIMVNDNLYKEIPVGKKMFHSTEKIELNQGNNHIEVYALNDKKVKSISDKLEVYLKKEDIKSPKVYFFGIGVSDYKNNDFDLKYSSKDIRDMADALLERYSDIEINLLLDDEVSVENINAFKQKLSQTQTDDIIIISFCGHGVLDKDYNWYFATHDMDFENPQKRGFSYDNLTDLTNHVKSRQKLVTIDACHSGEVDTENIIEENVNVDLQKVEKQDGKVVATKRGSKVIKTTKDKETTSFALMKQMFSNLESSNGTIVISASGGLEYAFEGGNYQNGVFTYSILSLFYDSVWNTLNISELQKTVMENVYKLTNGKQQPNVRTGTLNYDWIVW